jgi:ABC-type uncharacterized transport system auxiliary subunit
MDAGFWLKQFKGKRLGNWAMMLLGIAALAGCGGIPKTHYYTVSMPAVGPVNDPKTAFVLDVERFRAPEALRDDRILYYQSPTEMNFYNYHRWVSAPVDMTADLVARRLRDMDVFREVRLFPHSKPGDFVLKGNLLNFEELDYQSGGGVRVGLEMTLVRTSDNKVVWSDRRQEMRGVTGKGVDSVVKTLNDATAQVLNELLPPLAAEIEREPAESSTSSK